MKYAKSQTVFSGLIHQVESETIGGGYNLYEQIVITDDCMNKIVLIVHHEQLDMLAKVVRQSAERAEALELRRLEKEEMEG